MALFVAAYAVVAGALITFVKAAISKPVTTAVQGAAGEAVFAASVAFDVKAAMPEQVRACSCFTA